MPSVARRILEELFTQKPQWKRAELAAEAERVHLQRGGLRGSQDPQGIVKKALHVLQEDGLVTSPAYGQWRWVGASDSSSSGLLAGGDVLPPDTAAEAEDLVVDKELGSGPETVYVYFNPNDQRLATLEGRSTWECKIGRTAFEDPRGRVLGQGVRTALSRTPRIGLIMRTQDAAALEKALHASLRLLELEVADSPGSEWFLTSPANVEAWYSAYQVALNRLRGVEHLPQEK